MYKPSKVEIQVRLDRRVCVWCGVTPAIDQPYICSDCQRRLAEDDVHRRQNSHPEASLFPPKE
jgi:hypothetical protein